MEFQVTKFFILEAPNEGHSKSSMGGTHKIPFVLLFIICILSVYLQFSQVYFPHF